MESLSKHFRRITARAFAQHGFAEGDVVGNWSAIVGEDLAAISAPDRIKWPRALSDGAQKSGGTLVIRAAPGRALDLQYEASRITSRINSFFGYGAVSAIKVVQATELLAKHPAPAPMPPQKPLENPLLDAIEDGQLKTALERLGQNVAMATKSSPQDK